MKKQTEKQRQHAYEELIRNHVHWGRKNKNHIIIYTVGYLTQNAHDIENFLLKQGFQSVDQYFDKMSGNTITIFKEFP
jgi:hypothetical protein